MTLHKYMISHYDHDCPQHGQEHTTHWYPALDGRGSVHCLGWHGMHREPTEVKARFHAPYLRGVNSNIIHRSAREGYVTWYPPSWSFGPSRVGYWEVKVACSALHLKLPQLLDAEGVKNSKAWAPAYSQSKLPHKELMLCGKCFPINQERTSHPLAK